MWSVGTALAAAEHKPQTLLGRRLVVALGVQAPRRDVPESPHQLCVPAAPGRALAQGPSSVAGLWHTG